MRTIHTGMLPFMAIADGVKAQQAVASEAYLTATTPRPIGYAGGQLIWHRPPVTVTHICMRARRFRYARVSFAYTR